MIATHARGCLVLNLKAVQSITPELRKNVQIEHYEAGHMMYVHPGSMGKFSDTIKAFIDANAH